MKIRFLFFAVDKRCVTSIEETLTPPRLMSDASSNNASAILFAVYAPITVAGPPGAISVLNVKVVAEGTVATEYKPLNADGVIPDNVT